MQFLCRLLKHFEDYFKAICKHLKGLNLNGYAFEKIRYWRHHYYSLSFLFPTTTDKLLSFSERFKSLDYSLYYKFFFLFYFVFICFSNSLKVYKGSDVDVPLTHFKLKFERRLPGPKLIAQSESYF